MTTDNFTDEQVLEQPNGLFDEMMNEVFGAYKGNESAKNALRMAFQAGWLTAFSQQKASLNGLTELYIRAFRNDALARSAMQTETKQ